MREITEPLERWLSALDPDDFLGGSIFDALQEPLELRGWKLLFTAFAVSPEGRRGPDHRLLGMGPGMAGYVNDREQLVSALIGKRKKYQPEDPLVVAVLLMSSGTVDREDIESACSARSCIRSFRTAASDNRSVNATGSGFAETGRWPRVSRPS